MTIRLKETCCLRRITTCARIVPATLRIEAAVLIQTSLRYALPEGSKGKGKAVPLQARSGPECSRKLRFPDFMSAAQDGGKVSLTYRPALPPGNAPGTHFY